MPPRPPAFGGRRLAVIGAVGGLVLVLAALTLASVLDPSFATDRVGRNVALAGVDVSGLSPDDLQSLVEERAAAYGDTAVEIDAGSGPARSDADTLGLAIDVDTTVAAVLDQDRPGLLVRPFAWVASFFGSRSVDLRFVVDEAELASAALEIDLPGVTEAREPTIEADAAGVRLVPGQVGSGIDPSRLAERLTAAAANGTVPVRVEPVLVEVAPTLDDETIAAVAADADRITSAPLAVVLEAEPGSTGMEPDPDTGGPGEIGVADLRSWIVLDLDGPTPDWSLDDAAVAADLVVLFADRETPATDASFVVESGAVRIVPGTEPSRCCAEDTPGRIERGLRTGATPVELPLRTEDGERGLAWAESLGIVEEVGTFTTTHACCQNRVVNIHLIADATRGVVIEPGETFSLNGHVGQRTEAKGYLPAGGITQGVLVDQLGGGISQYTTTLFNAAFFAGLDFGEYQAHSIYFSRYPYGREATLSWPNPDLQIRNTSPYGVLIWPTYTDTSITVTLYSTRHVTAEQTGQRTAPQDQCTRVITERTRTWTDGRVEVDTVQALYRPAEGLTCAGLPSSPDATTPPPTTTTTTAPPTTTTTAPPTTTTTTAPPTTTTTTTTAPEP